jgi:RNA polymerase sigma-70 factor (ECF subfamily)
VGAWCDEFLTLASSYLRTRRARGALRRRAVSMSTVVESPDMAVRSDTAVLDELEQYRKELTGYCYRMMGSAFEAEDAVQETMVKAWKGMDSFEGRSAVRSWLYRIATNVCLDMLRGRQRRALAMDMGPAGMADAFTGATRPEEAWMTPIPDAKVVPDDADPAAVAEAKESIRLAFVTALQHLPARQRAVLILREVLRWQATEVAELLDTSVASVNSALQRARATLATLDTGESQAKVTDEQKELLARYVDAFERYDISSLVGLLRDDVVMSMPPHDFWLQGPEEMAKFFLGAGHGCEGSRLVTVEANGSIAFASYKPSPDGGHRPWSIQILEISGDRIVGHHNFLDTSLFEVFGLPDQL